MDLLILGLGWQGEYIQKYWRNSGKRVKATTRNGRGETIEWSLPADKPECANPLIYRNLPFARNVIITFPLPSELCGKELIEGYTAHCSSHLVAPNFILLGSTRAFHGVQGNPWTGRDGPVNRSDPRIRAEDWFLAILDIHQANSSASFSNKNVIGLSLVKLDGYGTGFGGE